MVHTADAFAADTLPYAPAKHAVHADVPVVSALYEPTKQPVHADVPVVSAVYLPAAHSAHTADVSATATTPNLPAKHPVQADVPVARSL